MAELSGIIRDGQVVDVSQETQAVRVAYDDQQNFTTGWLQVNFPPSGAWAHTGMPRIGDHVKVLANPNGRQEGIVIGTQYNAERMPQNAEDGVMQMYSEDGKSYVRLDAAAGTMEMRFGDGALFTFGGNVKIKCASVEIQADNVIKLNGKVQINGDITHDGNMTTSGRHTDANGTHRSY